MAEPNFTNPRYGGVDIVDAVYNKTEEIDAAKTTWLQIFCQKILDICDHEFC